MSLKRDRQGSLGGGGGGITETTINRFIEHVLIMEPASQTARDIPLPRVKLSSIASMYIVLNTACFLQASINDVTTTMRLYLQTSQTNIQPRGLPPYDVQFNQIIQNNQGSMNLRGIIRAKIGGFDGKTDQQTNGLVYNSNNTNYLSNLRQTSINQILTASITIFGNPIVYVPEEE